jgi:triosephosphate isomerase (TIM)
VTTPHGAHVRLPIVGGNWKMHTSRDEARALLAELRAELDGLAGVEVVILPPTPWLADAHDLLAGSTLQVGAQHAYWERAGAYTGEVSPHQLVGVADYVLVGHSERRQLFSERDEETASKLAAVLAAGLRPLLAVGETGRERRAGETEAVLERQLHAAFEDAPRLHEHVVIAYEPVWAIGTGETATPEQAEQACASVRAMLADRFDAGSADRCRVQYGGSVSAANVDELSRQPSVDGALVGGASLRAAEFAAICRAVAAAG